MLNKISDPKKDEFCIYQDAETLDLFFDYQAVVTIGGFDIHSKVIQATFAACRDQAQSEEVISTSSLLQMLMSYNPNAVVAMVDSHFLALADYWRNFPR